MSASVAHVVPDCGLHSGAGIAYADGAFGRLHAILECIDGDDCTRGYRVEGMGRIHTEPDKGLAILAGTLQDALRMHAAQRMSYFFWFLFCYKALTDRLRTLGVDLKDAEGVSVKATHQIAYGLRRDNPGYYDFVVSDPDIIKQPATACGKTDAAHYCNLGITPGFMTKALVHATPEGDPVAFQFLSMLEVAAGATRQLPQRINIGPDRIVDQAHGRMAMSMLDGSPPIAHGNYLRYLDECEREMVAYRRRILDKGYRGLAACCDCYLDFYRGHPGVQAAPGTARAPGGPENPRTAPSARHWA